MMLIQESSSFLLQGREAHDSGGKGASKYSMCWLFYVLLMRR